MRPVLEFIKLPNGKLPSCQYFSRAFWPFEVNISFSEETREFYVYVLLILVVLKNNQTLSDFQSSTFRASVSQAKNGKS